MAFFDTPQSSFDPYEQDRMQRMDMLKQASSDYGASMQAPLGFLDPEMQRYLESKTREDVRASNPKAGGSGWLADREATEMLKLRMAMLDKNLQESNNQRNYMAQLAGIQQPMQHVSGETGILSGVGSAMLGGMGAGLGSSLGQAGGEMFGKWMGGGQQQRATNPGERPRLAPYNPYEPGQAGQR